MAADRKVDLDPAGGQVPLQAAVVHDLPPGAV